MKHADTCSGSKFFAVKTSAKVYLREMDFFLLIKVIPTWFVAKSLTYIRFRVCAIFSEHMILCKVAHNRLKSESGSVNDKIPSLILTKNNQKNKRQHLQD